MSGFRDSIQKALSALPDKASVSGRLFKSTVIELAGLLENMGNRIDALERRAIATKGLSYRGVWFEGLEAKEGDIATDRGTLWYAERDTQSRPGVDSSWRLMVKTSR